jgi:hypothetical protein
MWVFMTQGEMPRLRKIKQSSQEVALGLGRQIGISVTIVALDGLRQHANRLCVDAMQSFHPISLGPELLEALLRSIIRRISDAMLPKRLQ